MKDVVTMNSTGSKMTDFVTKGINSYSASGQLTYFVTKG